MPSCYIIFSLKLNRFYVGATQDSVSERIEKHNSHTYGAYHFTATADDWELFLEIEASDYAQAIRIERRIKDQKSAVFKRNLKKYPELLEKLKLSTK